MTAPRTESAPSDSIFSQREIERRWSSLWQRLQVDCVVVPSFHNSYYLSGMPMPQWGRWALTVLFRDDEPVLVIPAIQAPGAERNSPIRDVRCYADDDGPSMETATSRVIDTLLERQVKSVGFEGGGMPARMYLQLFEALPSRRFEDVTDAIDEVRLVCSSEELRYLRAAAAAASRGMARVLELIGPGVRESELQSEAEQAMAGEIPLGVEWTPKCYMQQGERSQEAHAAASDAAIATGVVVEVVCECWIWSYQGAVERAILIGDGSREVERGYATMLQAFQAARGAVGPDRTYAEVDAAARAVFKAAGYEMVTAGLARGLLPHHTGGRIEMGNFRPFNQRKLTPGVVVTVEPWALMPGVGAPRHCDQLVVTTTGHEVLSGTDSGSIRVDAVSRAANGSAGERPQS